MPPMQPSLRDVKHCGSTRISSSVRSYVRLGDNTSDVIGLEVPDIEIVIQAIGTPWYSTHSSSQHRARP